MVTQPKVYTVEDFRQFVEQPENAGRLFELINGELVEVSPGRTKNSGIGHLITVAVHNFCRANNIPCQTSGGDGAYQIASNVAAPDFAYKRTPLSNEYPDPVAPAWAVDIVSPTDKPTNIAKKRAIYLRAKILCWEIYPDDETIHVFEPGKPPQVLGIDDTLDGGNVLPGFTMPVRDTFVD